MRHDIEFRYNKKPSPHPEFEIVKWNGGYCYTVATFEEGEDEGAWNLQTEGDQILGLDAVEFMIAVEEGFAFIESLNEKPEEVLLDGNIGYFNRGKKNIGDRNIGNNNIGNDNIGDFNNGDGNIGSETLGFWNQGDGNCGFFNTTDGKVSLFNIETNLTFTDCWKIKGIRVLKTLLAITEKDEGNFFEAVNSGLFSRRWELLSNEDKQAVLEIPYFNASLFRRITGIDVTINYKNKNESED